MSALNRLEGEFTNFASKVFPGAGEAQLDDIHTIWWAAILCATHEVAKENNLLEVNATAYQSLDKRHEAAMIQIARK